MDDGKTVNQRRCGVEGCDRTNRLVKDFCGKHYVRFRKHGDPLKGGLEDRRKLSYVEGDCGYLLLQNGTWATVDAKTFAYLNRWQWREQNGYVCRSTTKAEGDKERLVFLHREVGQTHAGLVPDHRNHDTLDNRGSAIRNGTRGQNTQNRRKRRTWRGKPTASRYKGVGLATPRPGGYLTKKWNASIRVNGRLIHLGNFAIEEEAALAYNKRAKEVYGEWAYLNVID